MIKMRAEVMIQSRHKLRTIHFFKQLFGLDEHYFGSFVTGATVSNMTSLAIARQWAGEQIGVDVSEEGAASIPNLK